MNKEIDFEKYPATDHFKVVDSIGVPHPYCIAEEHVTWIADNHLGIINKESIMDAEEKQKIYCGICKGKYSYEEHKSALLIEIDNKKVDINGEGKDELLDYLNSLKDIAEENGYVGFAFIEKYKNVEEEEGDNGNI